MRPCLAKLRTAAGVRRRRARAWSAADVAGHVIGDLRATEAMACGRDAIGHRTALRDVLADWPGNEAEAFAVAGHLLRHGLIRPDPVGKTLQPIAPVGPASGSVLTA